MSNDDLLDKLKGHARTFVVQSNTNPYAAAAAMGAFIAKQQGRGPYFNFFVKTGLIPDGESGKHSDDPAAGNIALDFKTDWVTFLRLQGMAACRLKYNEARTPEENTLIYLNASHRRVSLGPRKVHRSVELNIPQAYEADYLALTQLIESGGDLNPYLSRDIIKKRRPDKTDGLLNTWGMQHLHFRPEGTGHILLCWIVSTDVFVIQSLPHTHDVWVDTDLIQIVHDDWPELLTAIQGLPGESWSSAERLELRNKNANFTTMTQDGSVFLSPGGGVMASGDSADDKANCDRIFTELAQWEDVVERNAARFRASFGWSATTNLSVEVRFVGRDCSLFERTTGTQL